MPRYRFRVKGEASSLTPTLLPCCKGSSEIESAESPVERRAAGKVETMDRHEQRERARALVESFSADRAERERLKREADEAVAQFRRAVHEFVDENRRARTRAAA